MPSDYFQTVRTKSALKSDRVFTCDDSNPQLLLDYYSNAAEDLNEAEQIKIAATFREWLILFLRGFNIMVCGTRSKSEILNTFCANYLLSGNIPDWQSKEKGATLKVRVVKLHGLSPTSYEKFLHGVLNITESTRVITPAVDSFIEKIESEKIHYFFVIHSIDSFLKESKKVFHLILDLLKRKKDLIHIIASADHYNAGKVLYPLVLKDFIFFWLPGTTSFLSERISAFGLFDENTSRAAASQQAHRLFSNELNLRAIKDVYLALQPNSRWLMCHILEDHLTRSEITKAERVDSRRREEDFKRASVRMRQSTRLQDKSKNTYSSLLNFDELLLTCQIKFVSCRSSLIREYLGELADHRIISLDETRNKITCLIEEDTCKKLLEYSRTLAE